MCSCPLFSLYFFQFFSFSDIFLSLFIPFNGNIISYSSSVLFPQSRQAHTRQSRCTADGKKHWLLYCVYWAALTCLGCTEHNQRSVSSKGASDRTRISARNHSMRTAPVHESSSVSSHWHAEWQERPGYMCAIPKVISRLYIHNTMHIKKVIFRSWPLVTQQASIDDIHSLMYTILKKPELNYLTPDDFLPVLEDIVLNHPALQFLENNITFQERYSRSWFRLNPLPPVLIYLALVETVICRIYYDAHCPSGRLTFTNFKKSGIASIIQRMTPSVDLYTVSYMACHVRVRRSLTSLDLDTQSLFVQAVLRAVLQIMVPG